MFNGMLIERDSIRIIFRNIETLLNILPEFNYLKFSAFKELICICNQIKIKDYITADKYIELMKMASQLEKVLNGPKYYEDKKVAVALKGLKIK